jgi:succinate dehydrogenase / fumarate reductase iron-sulfur subunit
MRLSTRLPVLVAALVLQHVKMHRLCCLYLLKLPSLGLLPQGQPERYSRVQAMVAQMDEEGFGNCTNTGACEAECPKEITLMNIAFMNNDFFSAKLFREEGVHDHAGGE